MSNTKKMTIVTMLGAMAIILNVVEGMLIPPVAFGIRLGIANVIALIALEMFGIKEMIIVNTLRITIGSLLRGAIFGSTFWVSAGGVILSSIILIILYKLKATVIFKSILSAVAHSAGQVIIVIFLYNQVRMVSVLPVLVVSSLITGIFTGYVSQIVLKRVKV